MSKPNVRYYAKMELVEGTKTPKYVITSLIPQHYNLTLFISS